MADKKARRAKTDAFPFTNRELSWLSFNERVLDEAYERENPVLERMKFLAISASNLDEFFMVRVAGLKEQVRQGLKKPASGDQPPAQQLRRISERAHAFMQKQYTCLSHSVLPVLRKNGIFVLKYEDLTKEQRAFAAGYFERTVFPVLTPLAVDQSRPFPLLANRSLNLAVRLKKEGKTQFAVVQVPAILPRFLPLPDEQGDAFILLEDVIAAHLPQLFDTQPIKAVACFRITRNADLSIDEEAEDLLEEIENSIKKRKRGRPVRLELSARCDKAIGAFLIAMLGVKEADLYPCAGPLDLAAWMKLSSLPAYPHLRLKPILPAPAYDFLGCDDLFAAIRARDRLVHHPYDSFDCVIEFLTRAAEDPRVLAIKQTLYRVSGNSPVIRALMRAAENGKQVTVLVELKARFDEENNINWAKKLERAGCHVIYGVAGLKTHCKILLVVRQDEDGIRRYLHLGTGNYNDTTARLYTDIGMFTCREAYGRDASLLFNLLTGYAQPPAYGKFITAPDNMRPFFLDRIDAEIKNARAKKPSGITIKINSLLDPEMIAKLYEASRAGVRVDLIVRGICALVPQVRHVSERITVHSIIGQLLEHSRIFKFVNGGNPLYYLGSADLMPRNLDRRVELLFPVEDETLRARLEGMLMLLLADTVNTRLQDAQGNYAMVDKRGRGSINCQLDFAAIAQARAQEQEKKEKQKQPARRRPRTRPEQEPAGAANSKKKEG